MRLPSDELVAVKQALDGDRNAVRAIQAHSRQGADARYATAFGDLRYYDGWVWTLDDVASMTPDGHLPRDCLLHADFGGRATVKGFNVLLDNARRTWLSAILAVDGVPTALPASTERTARCHPGVNSEFGVLGEARGRERALRASRFADPDRGVEGLWEGWTAPQAIAAHILGLTRLGVMWL